MPIFDGLGRSLRWLRERQVKRQYQVAEGAGITKAMLSAYETGKQKPSLDTLEKILDALACDLNDLHNALQIVNGRPELMRHAGAGRDSWGAAADQAAESGPPPPDLYAILGTDETVPSQEAQAMTEMLGGFHKLLRYMHGHVPKRSPPAPAPPPRPTAVSTAPEAPPPPHSEPPEREGS